MVHEKMWRSSELECSNTDLLPSDNISLECGCFMTPETPPPAFCCGRNNRLQLATPLTHPPIYTGSIQKRPSTKQPKSGFHWIRALLTVLEYDEKKNFGIQEGLCQQALFA